MNPVFKAVDDVIGWCCRVVLYITLCVVFVILSANVGLRYGANTSIAWASELPELMFPWMIMAGVVLAAQHGNHIAVVILTQKLGAARRWVLTAGALCVIALYLSLAYTAWPVLEIAADERSPIMGVPGSVSVACLLVGFVMLALVTVCRLPAVWRDQAAQDSEGHSA
jgi:TRAP-type C4-dicarboxylate transport system permease small subunit